MKLKTKKKIQTFIIIGFILLIIMQIVLFYTEKLTEDDVIFESLRWSDACDGKNYTEAEMRAFCMGCFVNGTCSYPLDMNFEIEKAAGIMRSGGEVHCYMIVDGKNMYFEEGSYYGIQSSPLFTWQVLDASKSHEIEMCCGIERQIFLSALLGLEKEWPQMCVNRSIMALCTGDAFE